MKQSLQLVPEPLSEEVCRAVDHAEVITNLFRDFSVALPRDTVVRRDEPLSNRTTLRVGGPADLWVEPSSENALSSVLELCALRSVPWMVLGRGSNLLVRDGGFRGVVISLASPQFSRLEFAGDRIEAGAGVRLKHLAVESRRQGLSGLEFLEGIPGSLGGALRMNAGAMGSWTFDVVERLRCMSPMGEILDLPVSEVEDPSGPRGDASGHGLHGRGGAGEDGRVQPQAMGQPTQPAQRRLHLQEPLRRDACGTADRL